MMMKKKKSWNKSSHELVRKRKCSEDDQSIAKHVDDGLELLCVERCDNITVRLWRKRDREVEGSEREGGRDVNE